MTVCGQRSDDPGFFTSCVAAQKSCLCGQQVRDEQKAAAKAASAPVPSTAVLLVQPADPSAPTVEEVRQGFDVMRFLAGFVARPG